MQLMYLAELLDADERECTTRLQFIQGTSRERLTLVDKQWLAVAEMRWVKQVNRTRCARNATRVRDAIVAVTSGGEA